MHRIRRHRSFLHYALLLVVALGVMLQPVLAAMGELHDVEHAVAVQTDHGHSHHDGYDDPGSDKDTAGEPVGAHNLLHEAGFTASMALLEPPLRCLSPIPAASRPTCVHAPGPPIAPLTLPFRPPIA